MNAQYKHLGSNTLCSYDLPHYVTASVIYPTSSRDKYTILIYGHEAGLRILWLAKERAQARGDDEDITEGSSQPLIQFQDISLTSSVVCLATPEALPKDAETKTNTVRDYLIDTIVVAVACADGTIQLVTLPSSEPAEHTAGEATITPVLRSGIHQNLISSLSLTWTLHIPDTDGGEASRTRPKSRGRDSKDSASKIWAFIIASISTTGTGLLLVNQVDVDHSRTLSTSSNAYLVRHALGQPLSRSTVQFNHTAYPSPRCTSLLVTVPARGLVKVLNLVLGAGAESTKTVRTTDPRDSTPFVEHEVTLRAAFTIPSHTSSKSQSKFIVDARWAIGGTAIVALLGGGEFGLWDIMATGPASGTSSGSKGLTKGEANISGLQGGVVNQFTLSGNLLSPSRRPTKSIGQAQVSSSSTIPTGVVSVYKHANRGAANTVDETISFQYGSETYLLPSVRQLWQTESSKDKAISSKLQQLPAVMGSQTVQSRIWLLPGTRQTSSAGLFTTSPAAPDFVICGPSHLAFHEQARDQTTALSGDASLVLRPINREATTARSSLFASRDLEIDDLDRALDSMEGSASLMPKSNDQVGQGDDFDVDMASPSVVHTGKSRLQVRPGGVGGPSKLFG